MISCTMISRDIYLRLSSTSRYIVCIFSTSETFLYLELLLYFHTIFVVTFSFEYVCMCQAIIIRSDLAKTRSEIQTATGSYPQHRREELAMSIWSAVTRTFVFALTAPKHPFFSSLLHNISQIQPSFLPAVTHTTTKAMEQGNSPERFGLLWSLFAFGHDANDVSG
jgi:hypothetical protein